MMIEETDPFLEERAAQMLAQDLEGTWMAAAGRMNWESLGSDWLAQQIKDSYLDAARRERALLLRLRKPTEH